MVSPPQLSDAIVTRFAPSPTGHLHLGHAFSALQGYRAAREAGGRFLLRIEDIDRGRCRPEFEAAILEDLAWLGLKWEEPVRRQSEQFDDYLWALGELGEMQLLYACFCTRRDIAEEIARSPAAPHGPDGPVYPGICRGLPPRERAERLAMDEPHALRLDTSRALEMVGGPLYWTDDEAGTVRADPARFGDVVLARKDTPASYHLAVTVDDALQGVTLVTRGRDLFEATHVHRLLQALLGFATPRYRHHRLIVSPTGQRLAKRDRATSLRSLRQSGRTPEGVLAMLGAHL